MTRTSKRTKRPVPPIDLRSAPILKMLFEDIALEFLTQPFNEDGSVRLIRPTIKEHLQRYFHGYYQGQNPEKLQVGRRREILIEFAVLDSTFQISFSPSGWSKTFAEHVEALVEAFFIDLFKIVEEVFEEQGLRQHAVGFNPPLPDLVDAINKHAAAYA